MENEHSRIDDALHLSLHGTAIQPSAGSSRASSARKNSQSKQPPTPTPSREGNGNLMKIIFINDDLPSRECQRSTN